MKIGDIVKDLREMNQSLITTLDNILLGINGMKSEQRRTNELLEQVLERETVGG